MQLVLERGQAAQGFRKDQLVFTLKAQVLLSEREREDINRYRLADEVIFATGYISAPGRGLLALAAHIIQESQIDRLTVRELVEGCTYTTKNIQEMKVIEAQITEGAQIFRELLEAASSYGGREVIDL